MTYTWKYRLFIFFIEGCVIGPVVYNYGVMAFGLLMLFGAINFFDGYFRGRDYQKTLTPKGAIGDNDGSTTEE
jgi:hypothetical protein